MRFPRIAKKVLRSVGYATIILFISLGLFEILLRFGLYEPRVTVFDYSILFDNDVLFRIAPLCRSDINDMGYRGAHFDQERNDFSKRLLFLGDSFVMGYNVAPGETIAAALGKTLDGVEVFNMGVLAYGPDQSLVQLLEDGIDLNPDMVILGIFPANDFQDIDRSRLFSLDGGGRLTRNTDNVITDYIPKFRTFFLWNHLQYIVRPFIDKNHKFLSRKHEYLLHNLFADFYDWELLYDPNSIESRKKIDLMRAILSRFRDELKSRRIAFGVVIIPSYPNIVREDAFLKIDIDQQQFERLKDSQEGFFGPENTTSHLCEELRIPYLNLYPEFLDFKEGERASLYRDADWHLSAFGNQIAADLAASVLVKPLLAEISPRLRTGRRSWL
jgi:hypothetical protein